MYFCIHVRMPVRGNIKITINDLHFSPRWNTSSVQSNDCYLLFSSSFTFFLCSSLSPPFTGLTHSPTLSLYLAIFFPLSSSCLLCFRSATLWNGGKAFYIPHITAQLQSIAFMSAWIGGFVRNMGTIHVHTPARACSLHSHTHIPTYTHRHTSDPIHLLHNIIRISSSEMTHTAWDRD